MNMFELEHILQRNISPQEIFLDVFVLDGLPTRTKEWMVSRVQLLLVDEAWSSLGYRFLQF